MAFRPLPEGHWFGVVHKGTLLESPCGGFYVQLVEPPEGAAGLRWEEQLIRVGFGVPGVAQAVRALQARGVPFLDPAAPTEDAKGALTRLVQGVSFELVASQQGGRHA
jgi:4-hydroxyphenylpyruvate dioxygenase